MQPSKENILASIEKFPKSKEELFSIYPQEDVETVVSNLQAQGLIWLNKDGKYTTLSQEGFVYGVLRVNEKGYAFLEKIHETGEDIYIAENDLKGALHGDKVVAKLKKGNAKRSVEGKVIAILEIGTKEFVGTFFEQGDGSFVEPDDKRLHFGVFVEKKHQLGAVAGHKVVVKIRSYDPTTKKAQGEIQTILGHKNDPGVDILSIVYGHGINIEFSEETMNQTNAISDVVLEEDIKSRRDLRKETIVTIDGEDAKDLDDAVSIEKLPNGTYRLGVHIADVSHYVTEASPLDDDAFERGTSVYLVDRVIPMLPHRLSNGICSLNPNVDRLTLSCEMIFDQKGNLVAYELFESVINTTKRMTYTDVRKILLNEDVAVRNEYKDLVPTFELMAELSHILRQKRFDNGAIDFDVKEAKVVLDENGKTKDIVFRERSVAEKLIEDFMLAANETVATHFSKEVIPFIYRIHDKPHQQRLFHFIDFISTFGYKLERSGETVLSGDLQTLLSKTKDEEEGSVIGRLALRSMQQAKYTPENVGHYGLAMEHYTHFTSPIRRYPDLIVHRLIKEYLHTDDTQKMKEEGRIVTLLEIGEHASQRERRAIEAERDTMELKKAEYMEDKVGDEFDGIISSVTKFGFFVELDNTIEGLVHVKTLDDDHYIYDEKTLRLIGKKSKRTYTIGDKVKVKLINVNVEEGSIDFDVTKKKTPNKKKQSDKKDAKSSSSRKERFNRLYKK